MFVLLLLFVMLLLSCYADSVGEAARREDQHLHAHPAGLPWFHDVSIPSIQD